MKRPRPNDRGAHSSRGRPRAAPHTRAVEAKPQARAAQHDPSALQLPEALEARLGAGHPWVYRDHVPARFSASPGSFVRIQAGRFFGYALWDPDSPIGLRVFSQRREPNAEWVKERVAEAWALRRSLLPPETNAFRLLFGEGDGLPGIVVDVYAGFAVLVSYSPALSQVAEWVVAALSQEPEIRGVSERITRRKERTAKLSQLAGLAAPALLHVREHGLHYEVDLEAGQKTGLFLDHRDNRHYLRKLARGKSVLNLFAYTGAFSVSCAVGGAVRVTSVDIAAPAIAAAERNFALNGLDPQQHEAVAADVFEFLEAARRNGQRWDLVIADPPSFASSRAELYGALRAYKKLHAAALVVLNSGGLYAAASCTAQVSPEAFRETLAEGAARAERRLTVVHEAAHAPDHPYGMGHLEGRYLKFVLSRALPLA